MDKGLNIWLDDDKMKCKYTQIAKNVWLPLIEHLSNINMEVLDAYWYTWVFCYWVNLWIIDEKKGSAV